MVSKLAGGRATRQYRWGSGARPTGRYRSGRVAAGEGQDTPPGRAESPAFLPQPPRAGPGRSAAAPRTPFVLLILGLLGGGLVCLLVINTTLGASSFKITELQQANANLAQQEQTLQREVSTAEAPAQIEQRAYYLGMRLVTQLHFLYLGSSTGSASHGRSAAAARAGASGHRAPAPRTSTASGHRASAARTSTAAGHGGSVPPAGTAGGRSREVLAR